MNRASETRGYTTGSVRGYFAAYQSVLEKMPYAEIERVIALLVQVREEARSVYLFGNGGSAELASHFACDLGKGIPRGNETKLFRVISLCDNIPLMTAWANDKSYDSIFSEQIKNLMVPGDIAIAISGSGNSPNVLRALETARGMGGTTLGLTGFRGGKLKNLCDYCMIVPSDNMQVIEDFHLSICHAIFLGICQKIQQPVGMAVAAGAVLQSD